MSRMRRVLGVAFSIFVAVAVLVLGWLTLERLDRRPRTDDAYIDADVVHLAPDVSGRIVQLNVTENQAVQRGDVLFVIDPEPFQLKVDEASANVRASQAELAQTKNTVASQNTKAQAAQTAIASAQSQLDLATTTAARMEPLLAPGFASAEKVDQARTNKRKAEIALTEAQQQATSAREAVTSTNPDEERLSSSQAQLALAQRDLRETRVLAPCNGRVTGLQTSVGEYATTGKAVFTLIDTERWYAVGDFRETDLDGLHAGQRALVYVLSQPRRPIGATVDSLGYGVSPDPSSNSTNLPSVSRSLNWVRIAQRFPVRVLLDSPPPDLARVGASAVIVIDR